MPTGTLLADCSPAIRWNRQHLQLLDQRRLPQEVRYVTCTTAGEVASAIRDMVVRGAPAIGVVAAYAVALSACQHAELPGEMRLRAVAADLEALGRARPTAVNLAWALGRLRPLAERGATFAELAAAAEAIHEEDIAVNRTLARLGAEHIGPEATVLTHCNTGPLATGGIGTALGVVTAAWKAGKVRRVFFTETRPWMQGARLTAWELSAVGIPATLMVDSAAGGRAAAGEVDWFIVGADRIAANGDVVNKVGTAALASLTRLGGGRVMVVAPFSTVDLSLANGAEVPIERRPGQEIWAATGAEDVPSGITIENRVFDITPASAVDLLVTERGVIAPARDESPMALEGVAW